MSESAALTAAAASTLPTLNKNLSITNSSTVAITMLDGFGTTDDQVAYEQNLTQWTTTNGQTSIPAGASGTIVLNDTHDFNGTPTYTKIYSIIYAKPDTLFPVKIQGSMLVSKTQSYTPVTITNDDLTVMTQTEGFLQTIMANPSSPMAQNYATLLKAVAASATSDTDIDTQVSTFFTGTDNYKSVTLDSITTVQTYYSQFPYVWAAYQSSKSFYFYSSDGNTVTYQGSITITVPTTPTTDKKLPGFSFTFTDVNNNSTPLLFVNGQFLDNKATPNICLSGTFAKKSMLTKQSADENTIIPILSGTIHSVQVLGYDAKQSQDSDGNWSGMYDLLHPTNVAGGLALFSTFMGILFGIDFLSKGLGAVKDKLLEVKEAICDRLGLNSPEDATLTPDDVAEAKSTVEEAMSPVQQQMQEMLDTMKVQVKMNADLLQSMKDAQTQLQQQLNQDEKAALDDEGAQLENELEDELDAGVNNSQLDNDDDTLSDLLSGIDNATAAQLGDVLEAEKGKFADVKVDIDASLTKAETMVDADAKNELTEAATEATDAENEADTIDKETTDSNDGDTPNQDTNFDDEDLT